MRALPDQLGWTSLRERTGNDSGAPEVLCRPARPRVLTARQAEILALVGEGLTTAEIADRLTLAVPTVGTHIKNAVASLRARSRAHAVIVGLGLGELELRRL